MSTRVDLWEDRMEREHPRAYVVGMTTFLLLLIAVGVLLYAVGR